jgi:hypothetical protein
MALYTVSKSPALRNGMQAAVATRTTSQPQKQQALPAIAQQPAAAKPVAPATATATMATKAPVATTAAAAPQVRMTPKNAEEQAMRDAGFTGGWGAGDGDRWMQDPNNRARYEAQLGNATGVVPLNVADMTQNQDAILNAIIRGAPATGDMGAARNALQGVSGYASRLGTPISDAEYGAAFGRYDNKYRQGVIDAFSREAGRQADTRRSEISQNFSDGAFGSSRQGVENALVEEARENSVNDRIANLLQTGFDTTNRLALEQLGMDRDGYQSAASLLSSAAGNFANLGQQSMNNYYTQQNNALSAADRFQNQSQREIDAYYAEELRRQGYTWDQIARLQNALQGIPTTGGTTQPQVSTLQQAGGAALALSPFLDGMSWGNGLQVYQSPIGPTRPGGFNGL